MIRERNPDLNFAITALPAEDGYTGKRGLPYASWGIGVAANSEHQAEAWKLVEFLMSARRIPSCRRLPMPSLATSIPRLILLQRTNCLPTPLQVFQEGYLANEFAGLPVAEELMRQFDEQFQLYLDGGQILG